MLRFSPRLSSPLSCFFLLLAYARECPTDRRKLPTARFREACKDVDEQATEGRVRARNNRSPEMTERKNGENRCDLETSPWVTRYTVHVYR